MPLDLAMNEQIFQLSITHLVENHLILVSINEEGDIATGKCVKMKVRC